MRLFGGKPYCGNPSGNDHVGIVKTLAQTTVHMMLDRVAGPGPGPIDHPTARVAVAGHGAQPPPRGTGVRLHKFVWQRHICRIVA